MVGARKPESEQRPQKTSKQNQRRILGPAPGARCCHGYYEPTCMCHPFGNSPGGLCHKHPVLIRVSAARW